MPVTDLLTRQCTILGASAPTDDYDATPGAPVSATTVCELQQARSVENAEGAIQETEWRVYLPAGTDLDGADAIIVDGDRYELAGDPWDVWSPRLQDVSHVEAAVRRAG